MSAMQDVKTAPAFATTSLSASASAAAIRVQPMRKTKERPFIETGEEPEPTGMTEEETQLKRIGQFGLRFNALITAWQQSSKEIRKFFLDGTIPSLLYRSYLTANLKKYSMQTTGPYETLLSLYEFWQVMNSNKLPTFQQPTVLYRGVDKSPGDQLGDIGFGVYNILTNWTSSPTVALEFSMSPTAALYQATFPKGTRYFYTGDAEMKEFEYILPGGAFIVTAYPKDIVLKTYSKTGIPQQEKRTVFQFDFDPSANGQAVQTFAWPSRSKSNDTRDRYRTEIETKVLPDIIRNYLIVTTSLPDIGKQFEQFKSKVGYTDRPNARSKDIYDYADDFYRRFEADPNNPIFLQYLDDVERLADAVPPPQPMTDSKRGGTATDAQERFRNYIVRRTAEVQPPASGKPYFFLKIGPPGSGKSKIMQLMSDTLNVPSETIIQIDVDAFVDRFTDFLTESEQFRKNSAANRRKLVDLYFKHRPTLDDLAEVLLFQSTTKKLNVEFESTGSDASTNWLLSFLPDLKRLGYRIVVVYPYVLSKTLRKRLANRNKTGIRQVAVDFAIKRGRDADRNLVRFLPVADHIYIVDNNADNKPVALVDLKKTGIRCRLDAFHRMVCTDIPTSLPAALRRKLKLYE